MILLLALIGCGPKQAPADEPAPEPAEVPAPADPPAPTEPAGPESLVGAWTSAPCGPREYERNLTISADNTWAARDLVAPCPPDVTCIWSGIVDTSGTWTLDGDALVLAETSEGGQRAQPRPTRLVATATGADGTEGDTTCPYTR